MYWYLQKSLLNPELMHGQYTFRLLFKWELITLNADAIPRVT